MTPHFETVPEHWKHPEGPYQQAPVQHGGHWWLVNPFGSTTPWLTQSKPPKKEILPAGFEEVYGPRPQAQDFRGKGYPGNFQVALADWERNLKNFKGGGPPPWASEQAVIDATRVCEAWGLGKPRFFEGRYGWSAMFVAAEIPDFDAPAQQVIESTHLLVAQYQLALLAAGIVPEKRHPFVPPDMWPKEERE